MPRRFAFALLGLLVLLLAAFLLARRLTSPGGAPGLKPTPTGRPTAVVPPTPIPGRKVAVFFEGSDEAFHAEARELPDSSDEVAFLRSIASAVLEGPRRKELTRPFPADWKLRGAYRLRDGLVVLDLASPAAHWETGAHEEWAAAQTLAVTLAKNLPDVTRIVLLVGGEPVETLAGHVDLTHPFAPDLSRASSEPPLEAPTLPPTPTAPPSARPGSPVPLSPTPNRPTPAPARPGTRRPPDTA